jgi:hypothetical protein
MPGLIRGVARTAVIAGTATAVSNRVSRRQANKWAAEQQETQPQYAEPQYAEPAPAPAAPAPAAPSMDDKIEQLSKLGELKTAGILSEAEFEAEKAKILGS